MSTIRFGRSTSWHWRNHEDFNHPLIIIVTAITLLSVIAGIVLIPYRIRHADLTGDSSAPEALPGGS